MIKTIGVAGALVLSNACMVSPVNHTQVEPVTTVPFSGLSDQPGATISVQHYDPLSASWVQMASTTASTAAIVDASGASWYYWGVGSLLLPRQGAYWVQSGDDSSLTMRAMIGGQAAFTFTQAQYDCTYASIFHKGFAQAAYDCGVQSTSLALRRHCSSFIYSTDPTMTGCYRTAQTDQRYDFPFARSYAPAEGIQGVCHDANNWYFTSTLEAISCASTGSRIMRAAVGSNLNDTSSFTMVPNSAHGSWFHLGDCDIWNGSVWVAMEYNTATCTGPTPAHAIGRFNTTTLAFEQAFVLPATSPQRGGSFPWVARNPIDGFWYSSLFNADALYAYEIVSGAVYLHHTVGLPVSLGRVQGGEFSESGRLYISSDVKNGGNHGVWIFEVGATQAVLLGRGAITRTGFSEEIQGLTVWDLDNRQAPNIEGQVHTLMANIDDLGEDDLYFKHTRLTPREAR